MDANRRQFVFNFRLLPLLLVAPSSTVIAASVPSKKVEFSGAFNNARLFTTSDLRALPSKAVPFRAPDGSTRNYKGILLRELMDMCGLQEPDQFALRQSYVSVKGTDGYFSLFTWAELYINSVGDGVFLVYEREGQPLDSTEGEIALVSLSDSRPGPRYVKWASAVHFHRANAS